MKETLLSGIVHGNIMSPLISIQLSTVDFYLPRRMVMLCTPELRLTRWQSSPVIRATNSVTAPLDAAWPMPCGLKTVPLASVCLIVILHDKTSSFYQLHNYELNMAHSCSKGYHQYKGEGYITILSSFTETRCFPIHAKISTAITMFV